jgi:uncharacterized delta-60 repeat protein
MWLRSAHRTRRTPSARPRHFQPQVDALEDRCLLSAGALDPTFGSGGIVTTQVSTGGSRNDIANAVILQSDGKIVAAGSAEIGKNNTASQALVRYSPAGGLDTTFGGTGKVLTTIGNGGRFYGVAQYPNAGTANDGKIVAAGYTLSKTTGRDFALARYNLNGSLDTTFGTGSRPTGIVTTDFFGGLDNGDAVVLQPDGKIIVAGNAYNAAVPGPNHQEFALARYNANGTLDGTFGSGGKVTLLVGTEGYANAVALQPDGKIVVAGTANGTLPEFAVARFNSNGTPDTTFGPDHSGAVLTAVGVGTSTGENNAQGLAIQPDGKIIAVGWADTNLQYDSWALVRYNADGSADGSFGSGGTVFTHLAAGSGNDHAQAVALQADGKIVVAGVHNLDNPGESIGLARYTTTGSLDTAFNGTGIVLTAVGTYSLANAVAIEPSDGKIVVAGGTNSGSGYDFALARYLPSAPQIGSFTASAYTVTAGSNVTLTASNISDGNAGTTITQVAFYVQVDGTNTLLGYGTQTSPGVWTFTFTVNLAPGTYTLFAQASDSDGILGDLAALTLTVQ